MDLLAAVSELPGVRVVIVGSEPAEAAIRRAVPDAVFLGERGELRQVAAIYASFDVFVHSGPHDTFGETLSPPPAACR